MNKFRERKWLIVLIFYLLCKISLKLLNAEIFINLVNPLVWLLLIVCLIKSKRNNYFKTYLNNKTYIYIITMILLFILVYYFLGFEYGFTKSPYSHNIFDVLKNIIVTVVPIVGIEYLRNVLIQNNKKSLKNVVIITIVFILLEIDFNILENTLEKEEMFKYITSNIFPIIAGNILYNYLSLNKFYILPLIFKILVNLIFILAPIIPNLNWFQEGSLELVIIGFTYLFFKYKIIKNSNKTKQKRERESTKLKNILIFSLSIILICFMLGVFKYEPIAILSNSMVPTLTRGDVVVFKKLSEDELSNIEVGTIIIYKKDGKNISHRVVKKSKSNKDTFYITKGDNNKSNDLDEVYIKDILGVYVFHIKYVGFPTVFLNEFFSE